MVNSILLNNYRNLNGTYSLDKANLLVAANGSGKSNLLESIYFASTAHSFRPISNLSEYVNAGQDFGSVQVDFDDQVLKIVFTTTPRQQRRFLLNNKPSSSGKVIGKLASILFAPHSVSLVSDDPAGRRQDLDDYLSMLSSEYAHSLGRYNKVLKNRNALLKSIRDNYSRPEELGYWTQELVNLGSELAARRYQFFFCIGDFVESNALKAYSKSVQSFSLEYFPNAMDKYHSDYASKLASKYEQNKEKEIVVGQTLYGPHKDDYQLSLNGQNLRFMGSRGEQRMAVFIWKLAQHDYLHSTTGKNAILLIDDLMSELDTAHRETAAELLLADERYQFILTSADINDVPKALVEKANRLSV